MSDTQSSTLSEQEFDALWLDATSPGRWLPAYPTPDASPVVMVEPAILQKMLNALRAQRSETAPTRDAVLERENAKLREALRDLDMRCQDGGNTRSRKGWANRERMAAKEALKGTP
jgi:hypothetical protein